MRQSTAESPSTDLNALLSRRAAHLPARPILDGTEAVNRISFTFGFPDAASLPARQVADSTTRVLAAQGDRALQYGDHRGYAGLIDVLRRKLACDQGIDAARENVLVTAGSSQAIDLLLDAFVDWGDMVVSENPTFLGAVSAFRHAGATIVPTPIDDDGVDIAALERNLERLRSEGAAPKFIYVIPNFQNPAGVCLSLDRRHALLDLARRFGTIVIEDDAYFDLRYDGEHLPPLYALDGGERVVYMGTLSKTMGPGMRIGWLVGPPEIIDRLTVLKVDGGTNIFGSHVAADWLPRHLDAHVADLRQTYRRRRDAMLAALERAMPAGTRWSRPAGGFFIWVTFPAAVDVNRMLPQAQERGVD
ncbi:MAG TPA: PLP-dependent aminotransferase family protein, partial [Thermomicrobiales bacterium]|nr:PLP-dependent aminotransferase family protein [Thermomicrobiales bacterium]